mmetsp:Transcript_11282/g.17297  ORF Transcript_11282/g.17297 Transcript_11282/m.17297 type:complete len:96 (-) Transcript_11282:25-312(-)
MVKAESPFAGNVVWCLEKVFRRKKKALDEESLPTATVPSNHSVEMRSIVEPLINVESIFRELPCIEAIRFLFVVAAYICCYRFEVEVESKCLISN